MSFAGLWLRNARGTAADQLAKAVSRLAAPAQYPSIASLSSPDGELAFGYVSSLREARLQTPPARDPSAGLMIVGDLRLDNRRELSATLDAPNGESDAMLVLRAFQRWGEDCAARLLGDFALGIWDEGARTLTLIRDACGVRPLFYVVKADRVAFASRADVLLAIPGVSPRLDERAVIDYLGEFPEDEEHTLFADVRRLPPAHSVRIASSEPRIREYFDVGSVPALHLATDADYADALAEALQRSVARRVPDGVECGVLLSGGLDSTSVTCLAAEERKRRGASRLQTFSAVFPDLGACDERSFQQTVVTYAGTEHTALTPRPTGRSGDFSALLAAFGDPAPIGLHWLTWPLAEAAVDHNVSVLLTGIDGDRVVSHGGALLTELARSRQFSRLIRECLSVSDFTPSRKVKVLGGHVLQALLPKPALDAWDRLDPRKRGRFAPALRLLRRSQLGALGVEKRLQALAVRPSSTREAHLRSLKASDRNWDVELLDRLGASVGVEFRHPFFDRDVMALCVSFPGEQKRRGGFSRYVLRQAMARFAPDQVRLRKADTALDDAYSAWVRGWLARPEATASKLENLSEWVDVAELRRQIPQVPVWANGRPVDAVWRCVVFSRWLEHFHADQAMT